MTANTAVTILVHGPLHRIFEIEHIAAETFKPKRVLDVVPGDAAGGEQPDVACYHNSEDLHTPVVEGFSTSALGLTTMLDCASSILKSQVSRVLKRCAIMKVVRLFIRRSRASITRLSVLVSSALVGSSRIRTGAS